MAKLTRREWMKLAGSGLFGAMVLDVEQLLWVPGEKTIFLPPTTVYTPPVRELWRLAIRATDLGEAQMGQRHLNLFRSWPNEKANWREVSRTAKTVLYENWPRA